MGLIAFTQMLSLMKMDGADLWVDLPVDWLNGRTAYGGLTGALCLESALRVYPELPTLRSVQFSFVGPASGSLNVRPTTLRRGKSSVFVSVDLEGDAGLAVRALLCFGADRDTKHDYVRLPVPAIEGRREDYPSFFVRPSCVILKAASSPVRGR